MAQTLPGNWRTIFLERAAELLSLSDEDELKTALIRTSGICQEWARSLEGQPLDYTTTDIEAGKRILAQGSDIIGVHPSRIKGSRRDPKLVQSRHTLMHIVRAHTRLPLVEIGNIFGSRHPSTIISALGTVDRKLDSDDDFVEWYKCIEDQLGLKQEKQ